MAPGFQDIDDLLFAFFLNALENAVARPVPDEVLEDLQTASFGTVVARLRPYIA